MTIETPGEYAKM